MAGKFGAVRAALNAALGKSWEDWEIPREANAGWPAAALADHAAWWQARIARQQEIDAAIAQAADVEKLYDRPYADPGRVRVAGPFTVESLSPHRIAASDEGELADDVDAAEGRRRRTGAPQVDFSQIVIDYLKSAGIHQSDKSGKIDFDSVTPWPGQWIGAEGRFQERDEMRRAAILIGPEYGTVSRPDLTAAAREANETGFDMLIACAFNFDAHSSELDRLGPLRIVAVPGEDALFFAGDIGQRIFQHPFSWKALGIEVRGRSTTLKVCYRTSRQIRRVADRLLPGALRDPDGNEEERAGTISVFDGPAPDVAVLPDARQEIEVIAEFLRRSIADRILPAEIGLFVRSPDEIGRARAAVESAIHEADPLVAY